MVLIIVDAGAIKISSNITIAHICDIVIVCIFLIEVSKLFLLLQFIGFYSYCQNILNYRHPPIINLYNNIDFLLMDLSFFKVNGPSSHMIMMVSLFATLSTSSIIISPVNNENENIAFAQTTSTANGNNNTNMNNSLNGNTSITNKQSQSFQISYFSNFTRSMGSISSIQNNESGKPAWVLNGQWNLVIPKPLKINQTNPPNAALFSAGFEMIKTNGKLMHTHTIADFKLKRSAVNGNVLGLTGTCNSIYERWSS